MSATTAEDVIAGIEEKYRTCLDTGLKVYEKTETLIKINAIKAPNLSKISAMPASISTTATSIKVLLLARAPK